MRGNSNRGRASASASIDIVLCTPHGRHLSALLVRDPSKKARERWSLPWMEAGEDAPLDDEAARLIKKVAGTRASWLTQAGAFAGDKRHPGKIALSIAYVGVTPHRDAAKGAQWFPVSDLPTVAPRHRIIIEAALTQLRERLDRAPIAFRLLPAQFTLTELQAVYELLLGRRLHKASFRRSLTAAFLVEPVDEWRSEGPGRPAQLFRYAPRRSRNRRGGVRFESLRG